MANTRKDHQALLAALGIEAQLVMVAIPNKIIRKIKGSKDIKEKMPEKTKNRIRIRYGRLIVIKFAGWDNNNRPLWLCRCDCGREIVIREGSLQSGNTKSCGCLQREIVSKMASKNGKTYLGKNNPNYVHGFRCGKATKAILELKEEIRKRDNCTCQECDKTQEQNLKEHNRILDVHHIDGDNTNNDPKNMVALCYNCHMKIKTKR